MSEYPTMTGPQEFDIEAFVPIFNEASVVEITEAETIETIGDHRRPLSESNAVRYFDHGLRAVIRAVVAIEIPSPRITINPIGLESATYYVNARGDVTADERVGAYLYDRATRSGIFDIEHDHAGWPTGKDIHDNAKKNGYRFVSAHVQPQRTRFRPTRDEKYYDEEPTKTKGIHHFGIDMQRGSAIVAGPQAMRGSLPIKKGFAIYRGAMVVANKIGSNVSIGQHAKVTVNKISNGVDVGIDETITDFQLDLKEK